MRAASSWFWNRSASATMRAPPASSMLVASSVPRPPQPSKPTRTAELACVPRTREEGMIMNPAVPAAEPRKERRSIPAEDGPADSCGLLTFSFMTALLSVMLADQLLQIICRSTNVLELPRAGNFPFDGNRAPVMNFLEALDDAREIDFAFPYGNFGSELSRICGPEAVLCVDALNVGRQHFDGVYRIGLAVHDDVGEVEVDPLVAETDVVHGADQRNRGFLAGLVAEVLAISAAILRDFAHRGNEFLVNRIVWIFRDKAGVCLYGGDINARGEIGGRFDVRDTGGTRLARDQAYGKRAIVKIPGFLAGAADDERSSFEIGGIEGLAQACSESGIEAVEVNLARRYAQILERGHGRLGLGLDAEDQP